MDSKLTSGRWLLTVVSAACLAAMVGTNCRLAVMGMPPAVDWGVLSTIIGMVFIAYFQRQDRQPPGGGAA